MFDLIMLVLGTCSLTALFIGLSSETHASAEFIEWEDEHNHDLIDS